MAMEGSMSGSKILPAILLVAPAFVLLTMRAGVSEPAAEHCKARPGLTAPRGAHWYYRINRADKRHCWFLASEEAHANVRAAVRSARTLTSHRKSPRSAERADASAQAPRAHAAAMQAPPPAPVAAAPAAVAEAPAAVIEPVVFLEATLAAQHAADFIARWPRDLPSARDLNEAEPQTLTASYAERSASEDRSEPMPSWPLVTAVRAQEASTGEATLRTFSLAGGLAIPLVLLIGWAAKYTRPPHRSHIRDRWRAMASRLSRRATLAATARQAPVARTRRDGFPWPATPTDPAVDLKTSLAELMRDLRQTQVALDSGDLFGRATARKHRRRAFSQVLQAGEYTGFPKWICANARI
jgi:hypothetical protein